MIIVIVYCNYLEEMYTKQNSLSFFSVWYSQSSSMVYLFDESTASGPGNLQMVKKVVVTKGKCKDYLNEIQQSYELYIYTL